MPLPTPGGEKDSEFISRCMANAHMREKFPEQAQRAAVCYRQLRVHKSARVTRFLKSVLRVHP